MIVMLAILLSVAVGGGVFAFSGGDERTKKRVGALRKAGGQARGRTVSAADATAQKRKNVALLLKDMEKNRKQERPTMRRRLDRAGFFKTTPTTFWIVSGVLAASVAFGVFVTGQRPLVIGLTALVVGLGVPRWVLGFVANRRKKKFTDNFASAIDVIVRSVRSGLPVNEALRIVARESPDPVGSEFSKLTEGLKVGVTLDQGLKRMHESMPTTEVGFFGIVMNIQSKSGGNLSEALGNLSGVLRDRKRLEGKIKAMSSEAKASAMIIGSLPPAVMLLVYIMSPGYISLLFTERLGNLMLAGCVGWMGIGIFVMRKMINFKL